MLEEIFFHALIGSQYQSRDRADVLVFVALGCRTRFSFIIQNRTFPQPKTHFFFFELNVISQNNRTLLFGSVDVDVINNSLQEEWSFPRL